MKQKVQDRASFSTGTRIQHSSSASAFALIRQLLFQPSPIDVGPCSKENNKMTLSITLSLDNDAFQDDAMLELSRLFQTLAGNITGGGDDGKISDSNGNIVGTWCLSD